jgi:hypothetical protein
LVSDFTNKLFFFISVCNSVYKLDGLEIIYANLTTGLISFLRSILSTMNKSIQKSKIFTKLVLPMKMNISLVIKEVRFSCNFLVRFTFWPTTT